MASILDFVPKIIRSELMNTRTASVGKIVTYYPDRQTADIQPLIGNLYLDELPLKPPLLVDVPLVIYNSGGGILSFPINEGDNVLLVFSDRPLTNWKRSLGEDFAVPNQKRTHSINDAIGLVGLNPVGTVDERDNESVVLRYNTEDSDSAIKINSDGSVEVMQGDTVKFKLTSEGNFELLGDTAFTGDLTVDGNFTITGDVDITGDTSVKGALLFDGNVNITQNLTVGGSIQSTGTVTSAGLNLNTHVHAGVGSPPIPASP